jgi:hypothetical protein
MIQAFDCKKTIVIIKLLIVDVVFKSFIVVFIVRCTKLGKIVKGMSGKKCG